MTEERKGISLVLGIDKPLHMTSHDVVDRVRRIFKQRRVGHTGTLDPLASGVLTVCIGSATRLEPYLMSQMKSYTARICFGYSTTTDDSEGDLLSEAPVSDELQDEAFARTQLAKLIGPTKQIPPSYSAIKVDGKRAYTLARDGKDFNLSARSVEIYQAKLQGIGQEDGYLYWDVFLSVSKGTYIRSLARDLGVQCNTQAHLSSLRRVSSGFLTVDKCVSLEALEELKKKAALDPVKLLGMKYCSLSERQYELLKNGRSLDVQRLQFENDVVSNFMQGKVGNLISSRTTNAPEPTLPLAPREPIATVYSDELVGIGIYKEDIDALHPSRVFIPGVSRGRYS